METLKELKNPKLVKDIIKKINDQTLEQITLMEVCGTHTMTVLKSGLKDLLPKNIKLISGPGCPVCVTDQGYIDTAIELSKRENTIITTFGDLIRIPGTNSTLQKEKSLGRDIRVVYSPLDSLKIAEENKDKEVVFLAVGFETTTPIIALAIYNAEKLGLRNFSVLNSLKTMPEAMKSLVLNSEFKINGFICPGHVAAVIGYKPFEKLSQEEKLPLVIAGFEASDVVAAIYKLVDMKVKGEYRLENLYNRLVKENGSEKALWTINEVFESNISNWRGLGEIEGTGLKVREKYKNYDAVNKLDIKVVEADTPKGCLCGEILKGLKEPYQCKLYGKVCNPMTPVGACMVSEEGTCAAYYKYS